MKFKLIDLNIWLGGKLFEQAMDFLYKENPDLLTLQEVYNGHSEELPENLRTFETIKKELHYEYAYFSACFADDATEESVDRGNAIFSRFPIISNDSFFYYGSYGSFSENDVQDYPFFPRTLQHALIQVEDQQINLFNTQGIWGHDGKDTESRLKMSEIIVDTIKGKQNVILAGDFNVEPNTKSIQNIEKHLKNVFKDELKSTFNMERKTSPSYATAVVDMVFVSSNINVIDHFCPDVDISDHMPLVCTFELRSL